MFTKTNVKIAAAIVFAASLLLPFIKGTAVFVGTFEVNGFDKLGGFWIGVVALAAGLAYTAYRTDLNDLFGRVLSVLAAALAVALLIWITGDVNKVNDVGNGLAVVSVGAGVYVMLVAAITSVIASFKK